MKKTLQITEIFYLWKKIYKKFYFKGILALDVQTGSWIKFSGSGSELLKLCIRLRNLEGTHNHIRYVALIAVQLTYFCWRNVLQN